MAKENPIILTGIKPTGELHIGNHLGAIEPALKRAKESMATSYFFIADLHALNQVNNPELLKKYVYSVAAAWLASGLDLERSVFYRQSDIPEIAELSVILSAVSPKGWMNKAHAYKAARDKNIATKKDPDTGINMGLYTYPILMASDILAVCADIVPVGKDQVQHVEIARDIAISFNKTYKANCFIVPEYEVVEEVSVIPGIDGRKMSKSYNNTIPLFTTPDGWRKVISKIQTDSSPKDNIRDVEGSNIYKIYKSLVSGEQALQLKHELENGNIGWKEAKDKLAEAVELKYGTMNTQYERWIGSPGEINIVLKQGMERVRPEIEKTLAQVKRVVGVSQYGI